MSSDINRRIIEHQTAKDPNSYTAKRLPVELLFYAEFSSPYAAAQKEVQIKKWSKAKKEALIKGEFENLPNLAKKKFA